MTEEVEITPKVRRKFSYNSKKGLCVLPGYVKFCCKRNLHVLIVMVVLYHLPLSMTMICSISCSGKKYEAVDASSLAKSTGDKVGKEVSYEL